MLLSACCEDVATYAVFALSLSRLIILVVRSGSDSNIFFISSMNQTSDARASAMHIFCLLGDAVWRQSPSAESYRVRVHRPEQSSNASALEHRM